MTVAPDVERTAFEDLDGAVRALRERGLRLSTSRRLILQALFAAEEPTSAEMLARTLELELTSVYRNLETLERHGLVQHVHLGHGAGMYALVGRGKREYLYCERCGTVRSVTPHELDPVKDKVSELFGYQTRFTHFALVGLCPECSARAAAAGHGHHG
jgi:Fur family ferric uptake transcriptional regulator